MARANLQCYIHPFGTLNPVKYVVVCTFFEGKILLSRHRERATWETQGGHIEPGETALDAAKRELYEESGVREAKLWPVCDYLGVNPPRQANGTVYLAVAENLTYPNVSPQLFREARKVLDALR